MSSPHNKKNKTVQQKISIFLFAVVLLAQIGFVIYKAGYTGIIHDEAYTFFHFAKNFHAALTSYINPNNNHVLNSIFICFTRKYFGSYDHFIRIHSVISAILFSLSIAYIIRKTIKSDMLRTSLLGLVLLNWFIFDQSFLARGYSIALAAIYLGIAVILALLARKIKYRIFFWLPITVMTLMNFLAFGSMLSSLSVLIGINAVFVLLFSSSVFSDAPKKSMPLVLNSISIPLFTFICLYPLYNRLYKDILAARGAFGMATFSRHIKQVLVDPMVVKENLPSLLLYSVFVFLAALGLVFAIRRLWLKIKNNRRQNRLNQDDSGNFILLITVGTILTMFIYRAVFKMSLGYMRNGVFLVPLMLISSGILVDRLAENLKTRSFSSLVLRGCFTAVTILLTLQNLPSAYAVEVHTWKTQSLSGPLVHRLKDMDPDKQWRIRLTKKQRFLAWPLLYYTQFDHKLSVVDSEIWDVGILQKTEKRARGTYLDEDCFSHFDSCILVNPQSSTGLERWLPPEQICADEKH